MNQQIEIQNIVPLTEHTQKQIFIEWWQSHLVSGDFAILTSLLVRIELSRFGEKSVLGGFTLHILPSSIQGEWGHY